MTHGAKRSGGDELLMIQGGAEPAVPVYAGRGTVVLGRSGAGKTRWLRRVLGLERPPAEVRMLGRRIDVATRRDVVGWVPDGDGVFLSQSVAENVGTQHHGPAVDPGVAADALDLVGLAHRSHENVGVLTYNERRRVALARAIALQHPVLVVDGALDPTITTFLPVLLVQAPWVRTALFTATTADADVRAAAAVALVDDERVVAVGTLDELENDPHPDVKAALAWVTP